MVEERDQAPARGTRHLLLVPDGAGCRCGAERATGRNPAVVRAAFEVTAGNQRPGGVVGSRTALGS